MWVICAERQLNFGELAEVVSISPEGEESFPRGKPTQQGPDDLSGGLVALKLKNSSDTSGPSLNWPTAR